MMERTFQEPALAKIHVIHENSVWVEPLRAQFKAIGAPFEEWFRDKASWT